MVFRFMTSVITDSATAYIGARAFIMDGHMRLSDFVLRVMAKALFFFLMSIPAAAVALYVFPALQWSGLMMGLAAFPLVLVNMLWIGVVFSLIGARHPDLSQFIGNIFMFLFLLTPIIWSAAQMPPGSLRSKLVTYNPLYYLIETVRAPIIEGHYNLHAIYICGVMAVIGSLLAIAAYRRWSRWVPIWI
jgi:ABC-type polysaccharide/polyol phosphate export permease